MDFRLLLLIFCSCSAFAESPDGSSPPPDHFLSSTAVPLPSPYESLPYPDDSQSSPDDSLPSYLRGMEWHKVKEIATEDLRLSRAILPFHYLLELSLNVREHAGAELSDFNGTVTIHLNLTKPTRRFELHSNGLEIDEVSFLYSAAAVGPINVVKIEHNSLRETITISTDRFISICEEIQLQIRYRGIARANNYGLHETWNPDRNETGSSPFLLATNNFPSGARFWFPCFDDPELRATFELHVSHPTSMNAYSNTEEARIESISENRSRTVFEKTRVLPTYQVALSIHDLHSYGFRLNKYDKVRFANSESFSVRINKVTMAFARTLHEEKKLIRELNFHHTAKLDIHERTSEKLDVIVLDGTDLTVVQPGLITIPRIRLVSDILWEYHATPHVTNFTELLVGNHLTVRSADQMWLNDMFAYFLVNKRSKVEFWTEVFIPPSVYVSSLHERALSESTTYTTTTNQYLSANREQRGRRAAQILEVVYRLCPNNTKLNMESYVRERKGGFADRDDLLNRLSASCPQYEWLSDFISDYVHKPGRAFLMVSRDGDRVTIKQTRYHSSHFDEQLRDTTTRYTIPLLYAVDGITRESMMIPFQRNETSVELLVNANSTFLIERFDHLYIVYYENFSKAVSHDLEDDPEAEYDEENFKKGYEKRYDLKKHMQVSLISGLEMAHINYSRFLEQLDHYVEDRLFTYAHADMTSVFENTKRVLFSDRKSGWTELNLAGFTRWKATACTRLNRATGVTSVYTSNWDRMFNDKADREWERELHAIMEYQKFYCIREWTNETTYQEFLENSLLQFPSKVRPFNIPALMNRGYDVHWNGLQQFFFEHIDNQTDPFWDQITAVILNSATVQGAATNSTPYPHLDFQEEYLHNLRSFVLRNPRRAASMIPQIEMRMEREFIRMQRPKWLSFNGNLPVDEQRRFDRIYAIRKELNDWM